MRPITADVVDRFSALILGESGMGKTSLLRTIPESEGVYTLSAEGGLLSVLDLVKSGRIEGVIIESVADLAQALRDVQTPDMTARYKWLFIDSLTEIADRCVSFMKEKHSKASDTFKMWGDYADTMITLIKGFRDLPHYNVVFTCLPELTTDDMNRRYYAPLMQGNFAKGRLISYFDYVFFLREFSDGQGGMFRAFQTTPEEQYPAKARCWYEGQLEPVERPDLGYVQSRLTGAEQGV